MGYKKKNEIDWREWDHLLGTRMDSEIARAIGCRSTYVWQRRNELGIPVFKRGKMRFVNKRDRKKYTAAAAAEKYGLSVSTMVSMGFKKGKKPSKHDWSKWDLLLGTMMDKELSRLSGIPVPTIIRRRTDLNIMSYSERMRKAYKF